MSEPFLGEIKMFAFAWPPEGWALCNGATLPTSQNPALYSLLGGQFGADTPSHFYLPDFRGRVPMGTSSRQPAGTKTGVETVTLTAATSAYHTHTFEVSKDPATSFINQGGFMLAKSTPIAGQNPQAAFAKITPDTQLSSVTSSQYGGNQSHSNIQPTAITNYCIALQGTYPQRS